MLDIQPHGTKAAALRGGKAQFELGQAERPQQVLDALGVGTGIHQGGESHIAANPAQRIQICYAHPKAFGYAGVKGGTVIYQAVVSISR
jgi:hypothetical protein